MFLRLSFYLPVWWMVRCASGYLAVYL